MRVLQEQARLVVAGKLLQEVEKYLEKGEHRERKAVKAAVRLLEKELKAPFDELRFRAAECSATLEDWHAVRQAESGSSATCTRTSMFCCTFCS